VGPDLPPELVVEKVFGTDLYMFIYLYLYFCRLVFLGFTKCGQFVVSYSCQLLVAAEHSTLPVYVYKLQWWRFIPNSPLHMVNIVIKWCLK
jgi:hypothetical protein